MPTNRAAWMPAKMAYPYVVDEAPMPTPSKHEVIIRVHAVAINPAEVVVQDLGVVYESYPMIPGCDVAGEVVELGSEAGAYKVGDRVAGLLYQGAFQHYCAANAVLLVKLPDNIEFKQGCVVPLGLATSGVCLFEKDMLALDFPSVKPAEPNGKIVVIWGGSSSLGSCGIQQAVAAGYEVATTAGKDNHDYCRRLGAALVFDHASSNVVEEIVEALKGKESAGVFCAINADGVIAKCGNIATRLGGNKFVSIPLPPSVAVPDQVPDGVKVGQCWHSGFEDSAVIKRLFQHWLPVALANGTMSCQPQPDVIGRGLEVVQDAVDKLRNGVSAKKVVVEIA